MEALVRMRREGKIGEIGIANFPLAQVTEALGIAPSGQFRWQFNLFQRGRGIELASLCQRSGILSGCLGGSGRWVFLTGKFTRESTFGEDDHRSKLPAFQGEMFDENLKRVAALSRLRRRGRFPLANWRFDG